MSSTDPYTSDLPTLSIPEHDRLEGTFGTPTRHRRVGQVFVLFDRNQKILRFTTKRMRRSGPPKAGCRRSHP
jgi:hypothetical protein